MTDDFKIIADEFIAHFKRQNGALISKHELIKIIRANANVTDQNDVSKANTMLYVLIGKGLLGVGDHDNIYITPKGWEYESFDKVLGDEKRKRDLEESVLDSSHKANVSGTKVNKLYWVTLAVAIAGVFATGLTYFNDREKYDLQQQVKAQNTLIQSLQSRLSQKANVPSLEKAKSDSLGH